jgi:recombination protein RecT
MTMLRGSPKLSQCPVEEIMGAIMTCAQLGLEPNTPLGEVHIIPYYNNKKKTMQAQVQLGYPGIQKLAYNTREYQRIDVREVYENDTFRYAYGLNPVLEHVPGDAPQGEPVKYYAVYNLKNGGGNFEVWSADKVRQHAERFSRAFNEGPWQTDFPAMAKKTVLIALLKYAPKTIELAAQITREEMERIGKEPPTLGATVDYQPIAQIYEAGEAEYEEVKEETPAIDFSPEVAGDNGENTEAPATAQGEQGFLI